MLPLANNQTWGDLAEEEPVNLYHIIEFPAETFDGPIERETMEFIPGVVNAECNDGWWRLTVQIDAWADLDELNSVIEGFLLLGEI